MFRNSAIAACTLPAIPFALPTARMSKAKHAASRKNRRTLFRVRKSRDASCPHHVCSVLRNNIEDQGWPRSTRGESGRACCHSSPRTSASDRRPIVADRPILLKNCSRLSQRGFAGGHKPSPARVAFNSGHSMRSNFSVVPTPLRQRGRRRTTYPMTSLPATSAK